MLFLQRDIGEIINIGQDIEIHVLKINPFNVTLGIAAPDDVSIWRNEIYRAIHRGDGEKKEINYYRRFKKIRNINACIPQDIKR